MTGKTAKRLGCGSPKCVAFRDNPFPMRNSAMNEHNTHILFNRYPRLYRGRTLSFQDSAMSWGFECGDGWFDLINRLSSQIEEECRRLREVEGWDEAALPIATQVKEKLGTLRFRMTLSRLTPAIESMIDEALVESQYICERCGQQHTLHDCPTNIPKRRS